jgi:metal-responsive CopG/Arc/MetJ family transcriptional regulator
VVLWRQTRDIHISIPEELLAEVDAAASDKYMSRSEYVRLVLDKEVKGKFSKAREWALEEDPAIFLDTNDS